jgi:hypothetical protein
LIEDYAAAFIRDMSSEVRLHIRKHPSRFHKYYAELPREKLLKKLSSAVDSEEKTWTTMKRKEHYPKLSELVKDLIDYLILNISRFARDESISWTGMCSTNQDAISI